MLKIEGKTFMNIQEAVQWLLDNNALPFQSSANYVANTEIGLGTIVNPSPAKVRIGSLIFFADSKVSTVVGITETGFICSDKYNNLVDDIAYVTSVTINASGHLITTLSDEQTIDAGIIKQVSGFSINASQHLIVTFNDGTTTDLGAIFSGNVNIAGNLTADSIVENMSGYSASLITGTYGTDIENIYTGAVKNGNKLTLVFFFKFTMRSGYGAGECCRFFIPSAVGAKLFPFTVGTANNILDIRNITFTPTDDRYSNKSVIVDIAKGNNTSLYVQLLNLTNLVAGQAYFARYEATFLLSDNLVS